MRAWVKLNCVSFMLRKSNAMFNHCMKKKSTKNENQLQTLNLGLENLLIFCGILMLELMRSIIKSGWGKCVLSDLLLGWHRVWGDTVVHVWLEGSQPAWKPISPLIACRKRVVQRAPTIETSGRWDVLEWKGSCSLREDWLSKTYFDTNLFKETNSLLGCLTRSDAGAG